MIHLISYLFIKDYKNYQSPSVRTSYGILSGIVGIVLNLLLASGKWIAGTLSGSISMIADAANNLSDAGSSVISLLGFKLSAQKPDPEHPFGHGRMEYISGLFISVAILIMGFELVKTSVEKVFHPAATEFRISAMVILTVSILVKIYMFLYNRWYGTRLESTSMKATAMDSLSDTIATSLVLAASIISHYTGLLLDGWLGILVGAFIFYTGIRTMKDTIDPLLGQAPKQELVEQITGIVNSHSMVYGMHDLIVHDYGPGRLMISLHAEVPSSGDLNLIHDQIDHIERELSEKLHCSAVIHIDPIVTDDPKTLKLKEDVLRIAASLNPNFSVHDFRLISRRGYDKILFDLAVPFDCETSNEELVEILQSQIGKLESGNYVATITIDRH
ncbi:MAG: cation diffusion facilitator family transporter [Eubacteriales bacterium]|nr:cation diffusion facilitator family transporter [Eubacteriales bacterium]